jgi:hypothetical protein
MRSVRVSMSERRARRSRRRCSCSARRGASRSAGSCPRFISVWICLSVLMLGSLTQCAWPSPAPYQPPGHPAARPAPGPSSGLGFDQTGTFENVLPFAICENAGPGLHCASSWSSEREEVGIEVTKLQRWRFRRSEALSALVGGDGRCRARWRPPLVARSWQRVAGQGGVTFPQVRSPFRHLDTLDT